MDKWNTVEFFQDAALPHIFAIVLIVIFCLICAFIYYVQNKNIKPNDEPKKFTLLVDGIILTVKKMVIESFGPKFVKITPYFIFLIVFLLISNIFAIFGMREPTTSYTVPLTLGFITWFSSIFCAIRYQKLSYLKKFFFKVKIKNTSIPVMVNPIAIMGEITPLISLTFRLWGNIIAGYIIYAVIFWACSALSSSMPYIGIIIVGGTLLMPSMIGYFSLFAALMQAYVFTLLSISYISNPINEGLEMQEIKDIAKKEKFLKKE